MERTGLKIAILAVLAMAASPHGWAAAPAAVSGVVRNAQGVAQMGALVQVVGPNAAPVGTAYTDLHGRYLIANLLPGRYEVRASAALFAPALRANLQLSPGARAVVNLTMSAIFDAAAWIPAERRKADEPNDDWTWTLRSVANKPILRVFDENGDVVMMSSSAAEHTKSADKARASVQSGDGGFGTGGIHNVVEVTRSMPDGSDVEVRADLGTRTSPELRAPSTSLQAGYQRRFGMAGSTRLVASFQSHPEMVGMGGVTGLDAMQLASAQKTTLGDSVDLEVGGTVYVLRGAQYGMASRPFLRVTAHPAAGWTAGYRMATSRDLQSFGGLDTVELELPVGVLEQGRMRLASGLHQEFLLGRKAGRGIVQISYYKDNIHRSMLAGGGQLAVADLAPGSIGGVLADTATDTFRTLGSGYRAQGVSMLMTEPITSGLWVAVEYSTGTALGAPAGKQPMHLDAVSMELKPVAAQSATVALKGRVVHSGTQVRASYRYQPEQMVTAVNSYAGFSDQAYLSFLIRQPVRIGRMLPDGLEATVDITNLLEQGYRPVLSRDGRMLFLAQAPRMIQAGLAFNF
ncbi:MAG TPA: carboxypeptidase-like regulatory domain-containing protein [Edaphobacter sp.]|nr:carboxypeptidase-like regulatory domain-containing protein [Edaphobacter sp.]